MFPLDQNSVEQTAPAVFFVARWFVRMAGNTPLALSTKIRNAALPVTDTNFHECEF
jgi:hypothetical protein